MGIYDAIKSINIITIGQGSDYNDTVTVMQTKTGPPVDLTGYIVKSQLRTVTGSLAATFVCMAPDPATGVINRTMTAADTALLVPAMSVQHVWGIHLTAQDGTVLPEIHGGAMISPEVVLP